MNLQPLHDRLIVRRLTKENISSGGIVIPDMALEPPDVGLVLAVGPGRYDDKGERQPMQCKVGDTVMFGKYAGATVKIDGEELVSILEQDIVAIMDK